MHLKNQTSPPYLSTFVVIQARGNKAKLLLKWKIDGHSYRLFIIQGNNIWLFIGGIFYISSNNIALEMVGYRSWAWIVEK
jgi:hypothetical protein